MTDRITGKLNSFIETVKDGSFFRSSVFRFILIGIFNTIHNFIWYNLFLALKVPYQIAFTFAFIIAMTASFFLNTKFTFRTRPTLKKFLEFPVTALPNFIISQVGLKLLVDFLHFPKGISGLLTSLVAIPVTFIVTRFILTRDDKKENDAASVTGPQNDPENPETGKEITEINEKKDKKEKLLDMWDIMIFMCLIVFSLLLHKYIFDSGVLYGDDSTDSTVQMIYFLPYLIKEFILKGHFWSWNYGMGGDIFSEFSYYYTTSPVIWSLYPLFRMLPDTFWTLENSLKLKLFISIYKQVFIMFFMYVLLRYEKRSRSASFAAAIVYGGGIYYMWNSNFFDFMTDAYLWVPLMVLGFRIYEKKKNYWPLIISAALQGINNFYFAFHTYMFFIVFVIFFVSPKGSGFKEKLKSYFSRVGQYALMGVSALLLSMFAFLPQVMAFLKIDRFDTVNPVSLFYAIDFYKNMAINLFFNNSTIGIPMLIILVFFINYRKTTEMTKRKMAFLIFFVILYCLPFTGYFLNGMNYHSERWFYLLIFVFAYALCDILEEMRKKNFFNIFFFLILSAGIGIVIKLRWDVIKGFDDKPIYAAVLAFNLLAFFLISIRRYWKKDKFRKITDITVTVLIFGIMVGNNLAYAGDQDLNMNQQKMAELKMESPELHDVLSRAVPEKNAFFRTVFKDNKFENAPTYYGYYGISTFSSMTDGNMHDWLKRILDIRHDIVYLSSFNNLDDRAYLESLLSVKYLVTEKGSYKPPAIYNLVYYNNQYELWENRNYVGLDMWFDQEMPMDRFLTLKIPDKDINLLNYAITEKVNGLTEGEPLLSQDISNEEGLMELVNADYTENGIEFHDDSHVRFNNNDPSDNSQIYIHYYLRPDDRKEFQQRMNDKKVFKSYETNPYVYYTNDWTWAIPGNEKIINWTTATKSYELKDLYLNRVDLNSLKDVVAKRNKYNTEDLVIENDRITGTVNNKETGIMVFNIPYNKGWKLTDNGKSVKLQRMNGFLSGIKLEPGEHKLVFTFRPNGLLLGTVISFVTLLSLLYFRIWRSKNRPSWLIGNPDAVEKIVTDVDPESKENDNEDSETDIQKVSDESTSVSDDTQEFIMYPEDFRHVLKEDSQSEDT